MRTRFFGLRWFVSLAVVLVAAGGLYLASHKPFSQGDADAAGAKAADLGEGQRPIVCLGRVDLAGGVTSLTTSQPTRVLSVLVGENQHVAAGTPLLTTDDRAAREAVREAQCSINAADEQLAQAKQMTKRHDYQIAKQKSAITAAEARLAAAKSGLDLKRTLVGLHQVNAKEVDVAEQLVREAEAGVAVEKANLAELELVDPQQQITQAEADTQRVQAKLALAKAVVDGQQLSAPSPGTVLRVLTRPGEIVSAAAPAMLFAPDGPRIVRAEIEQAEVARVEQGAKVTIEDDAVRGQHWRGMVTHLADWYSKRRTIMEETPTFTDVPTVECLIAIDEDGAPPRIGQRVRVYIEPKAAATQTATAAAAPAKTPAKP